MTEIHKSRMHIRAGLPGVVRAGRPNRRVRDLSRFNPSPRTTAAKLLDAARGVFNVVDFVAARRDGAAQSGTLTERGIEDDTRQFALRTAAPILQHGRDLIASAKRELEEKRETIELKALDTSDSVESLPDDTGIG